MAEDDLVDLLGCAALERDLGGILFVDLDPRLLLPYATLLAGAIHVVQGHGPTPTVVGAGTSDEQLWPDFGVMVSAEHRFTVGVRPGLLGPTRDALLVVPDLARAGTPVTRAIVTTLGADVVHVERPGISQRWPAGMRWLAACASRDLPALSAHLLDRFAVRVDGRSAPRGLDPAQVSVTALLGSADACQPGRPRALTPDLIDVVLRIDGGRPSIRRSLAVARVARALAQRRGAEAVQDTDVRRAAALVGVTAADEPAAVPDASPAPTPPVGPPTGGDLEALEPTDVTIDVGAPDLDDLIIAEASAATTFASPVTVARLDTLHPEDQPDALAEPRLLRWAVNGTPSTGRLIGTIVGHERSYDLRDLAVMPTLLESLLRTWSAAQRLGTSMDRPVVMFQDLRRHRRKHGQQRALVLVLDHSVGRGWDGSPGLAPHLRWAYDQGAAVSVIEFGHADSRDELRPERYRARSIADARIVASLRRSPGAASPLAAAVELAAEELRRQMRRGWASVRSARLVLVTDGRGNVPLEATARRRVTTRIARQGIDDALATARTIADLHRVAVTIVAPVDEQYPTLTADLALALHGTVTYVDDMVGAAE